MATTDLFGPAKIAAALAEMEVAATSAYLTLTHFKQRIATSGSSAIVSASYDPDKRELTIVWTGSRRSYRYQDVPPQEAARFIQAGSKGGYANAAIKGEYDFK